MTEHREATRGNTAEMELLAFGGPLNEQFVTVDGMAPVFAAHPDWRNLSLTPESDPTLPSFRQVLYDVERIGYHDERRCTRMPLHDAVCCWEARCLVAEGYPKHRITDTLNALSAWCWLLAGGW